MFYTFNEDEIRRIEIEEIDSDTISVGYLTLEELQGNMDRLGINENVIRDCIADQTHFRTSIDIYDEFSFGIINILNVLNVNAAKDRMAFIIKRNQFLLVKIRDEDGSCQEMFENAVGRFKQNMDLEKVIFGILERLLANGNQAYETTERKIMNMEQTLVEGKNNQDLNREIFNLRNELALIKRYYEQLVAIGEELQENQNNLFEKEDLRYFKIFTDKAGRLSNNTQTLCDNLIHLREALDASLNYNLNKIMKVFTVVTTIFMPLTLLVGWYGMNFTYMPELSWVYGYPVVIVISVLVVIACIIFFKKKRLL